MIEKLKEYLRHKLDCALLNPHCGTVPCTCGLNDLIAEAEKQEFEANILKAAENVVDLEREHFPEAERPVVKENLTSEDVFVKALNAEVDHYMQLLNNISANGSLDIHDYAKLERLQNYRRLLDIIDRQAKEIEQMKRLVSRAMQTDLDNLSLIKENSKLKAALRKIIDRESFCNNCFEDKSIAEQALKDCNDKEA